VAVANPTLNPYWLKEVQEAPYVSQWFIHFVLHLVGILIFGHMQIERHWSHNAVPELTLEKLQLIATIAVDPRHKVKWLKWMNDNTHTREAWRFPPRPVNEEKLGIFLAKAAYYAGLCLLTG